MSTFPLAPIFIVIFVTAANAEIYNYSCKICAFPSDASDGSDGCEVVGPILPLRVDDNKNILEWRGRKYDLTIASNDESDGCAKYGWHATRNNISFLFCTATQGYAAIEDKNGVRVQCNLKR